MNAFRQIATITAMNLKALRGRIALALIIVIGMAMVVGVMLSLMSMSRGLIRMVEKTGEPDRIILLSRDAQNEGQSGIARAVVQSILDLPGIRRGSVGEPLASADMISSIAASKKVDGVLSFLQLRGVSENFLGLHPEIRITAGRVFTPALHEVIVGRQVAEQFSGYQLNDEIVLPDGDWKVVGVFDSDGLWSSAILADAATLMSTYRRATFNSVTVRIDRGDAAYSGFAEAMNANPNISADPQRETAYYAKAYASSSGLLNLIAYWVGGIMGLGASFGALNTMYSVVSTRSAEIGTLRAIGFSSAPVVVSILTETFLLAFVGAVIGAFGAWAIFNGKTHVFGNFPIVLSIDGQAFIAGLSVAAIVSTIGALFPAIRAARLPVATALQVR